MSETICSPLDDLRQRWPLMKKEAFDHSPCVILGAILAVRLEESGASLVLVGELLKSLVGIPATSSLIGGHCGASSRRCWR